MKALIHVSGPRDARPGERQAMLDRARRLIEQAGVAPEDVIRIDVPAKATDTGVDGGLRSDLEPVVPALQSGSLFGGRQAVVLVDAHHLLAGEAAVLAGLAEGLGDDGALLVAVSAGAVPSSLARVIKASGEVHEVKKLRDRDASEWLAAELRHRRIKADGNGVQALLHRFGTDIAGLSQALDQLEAADEPVTAEAVQARFRNRPDEPMWHYADAVAAGDAGEALRRLADFLTHGHPLQLLAFLENDVRRRSLALAAPDLDTFAEWLGASPRDFPAQKAWRARRATTESDLRAALDALARADLHLKGDPEETHAVTMERLTVALSRWLGGRARRAG